VGCFLLFSALSFCFSVLFSCPVTSFLIPNGLLLSLLGI
jgi:hypothetical protein